MNKVILLIPHYNNIAGLLKSINSIGENEILDVLIVDDGSDMLIDENKIRSCFKAKGSVFFEYLEINKGIENTLNKGLEFILEKKYKYTARLDCGDICIFNRFEKQESFLEENKDIYLVGSDAEFVDTKGFSLYVLKVPRNDEIIRKKIHINSTHIHPTIMFRNSMLDKIGLYPTNYKVAEDYAFLFKVLKRYKLANINNVLVKVELNPKGISSVQRKQQVASRIQIMLDNFYFGFYPIYGLLRSILLYFLPLKLLINLKRIVKK